MRRGHGAISIGLSGFLRCAIADPARDDVARKLALGSLDTLIQLIFGRAKRPVHRHPHRLAIVAGARDGTLDPAAADNIATLAVGADGLHRLPENLT